jgi:hypothetical protein
MQSWKQPPHGTSQSSAMLAPFGVLRPFPRTPRRFTTRETPVPRYDRQPDAGLRCAAPHGAATLAPKHQPRITSRRPCIPKIALGELAERGGNILARRCGAFVIVGAFLRGGHARQRPRSPRSSGGLPLPIFSVPPVLLASSPCRGAREGPAERNRAPSSLHPSGTAKAFRVASYRLAC